MLIAPSAARPDNFVDSYGPQWDVEIVDVRSSMDDSRLHSMDGLMVRWWCWSLWIEKIQPGIDSSNVTSPMMKN